MKIGSLFSGAGGLDLAAETVFDAHTVWQCEIDPSASKVLAAHWPDVPNLGSITDVDFANVEPVDVLCGGFPCQDVSSAGRRAGIRDGTRSGLWTVFADAIATLRPPLVIIENVRGLLSARAHRAMEPADATLGDGPDGPILRAAGAVLGDLADLGFDAVWATVAASSVGAPHRRERVFIVATDAAVQRREQQRRAPAREQDRHPSLGGETPLELLPTPKVAAQRASRKALTQQHWTAPALEQALEIARGELPREYESWDEVQGRSGALLPTPRTSDTNGAGAHGTGGLDLRTAVSLLPTPKSHRRGDCESERRRHDPALEATTHYFPEGNWGKYEPAIRRWENVTRPAPAPTEPNSKGNPRLNPEFSEWLMGWPAGWVTDSAIGLGRNNQLRIVGNGVCTQQATAAIADLLDITRHQTMTEEV